MRMIPCLTLQHLRTRFNSCKASWKILIFLLCFMTSDAFAQNGNSMGQDIVTIGKVKAISSDQKERAFARGDLFYVKDTIVVDVASKAQLKFSDGGLINLIASTEFRVDSYIFKDPNQKSQSVSTLFKGGFRAISGSIAKENITGTQIKTPLAVIGLRGTLYEALLANGKLFVGCFDGTVAVTNAMGEVEIGPHSNALYAMVEKGKAPTLLKEIPVELAAVSFEIPGGEPMEAPAVQLQGVPAQGPYTGVNERVAPPSAQPLEGQPMEEMEQNPFAENFAGLNLEEIPYEAAAEGCAYDESRGTGSYLAPAVAIGTLSVVGIIAIVSQCTHHHDSSSSSSSSSRSYSYSRCSPCSPHCHCHN